MLNKFVFIFFLLDNLFLKKHLFSLFVIVKSMYGLSCIYIYISNEWVYKKGMIEMALGENVLNNQVAYGDFTKWNKIGF